MVIKFVRFLCRKCGLKKEFSHTCCKSDNCVNVGSKSTKLYGARAFNLFAGILRGADKTEALAGLRTDQNQVCFTASFMLAIRLGYLLKNAFAYAKLKGITFPFDLPFNPSLDVLTAVRLSIKHLCDRLSSQDNSVTSRIHCLPILCNENVSEVDKQLNEEETLMNLAAYVGYSTAEKYAEDLSMGNVGASMDNFKALVGADTKYAKEADRCLYEATEILLKKADFTREKPGSKASTSKASTSKASADKASVRPRRRKGTSTKVDLDKVAEAIEVVEMTGPDVRITLEPAPSGFISDCVGDDKAEKKKSLMDRFFNIFSRK